MPDKEKQPRLDRLQAVGSPLAELPEVDGCEYLITYLMDVGPAANNGMGQAPVSYSEIKAWAELTDTRLSPWDAEMIRRLSRVYVQESIRAKDPGAPAPYRDKLDTAQQRAAVVAGFKSLAKRKSK